MSADKYEAEQHSQYSDWTSACAVGLTLCCSCLNPYCLGRKTAFFFSGHLNLHAKPETGIPYREKDYNN
jgi:hypothetical protein